MLDADGNEKNRGASDGARRKLLTVKALHTAVWAFFAGCIVALPVLGAMGQFRLAGIAVGMVLCECGVLFANGRRCPMTGWAARYTSDRRANFDIFLPLWLAERNQTIFGILFVFNGIVVLVLWVLDGQR